MVEPSTDETVTLIRQRLERALQPIHLELHDESAKHAGHPGATSGGGHYRLVLVSAAFESQPLLARHRMVNEALRDMFGERIHALSMKTLAPQEWPGPAQRDLPR